MAVRLNPSTPTPTSPRPECVFRRWLCLIVAAAAVLRIILLAYAERHPARFDFPDSHRYVLVATNIAAGKGPVESDQVRAGTDPLYPIILSVGARMGVQDEDGLLRFGRIVNCLFGLASVALLAVLARRLLGERPALIAAAILAVDPILLFFNALVLTETPYTALLLAAFCCLARLRDGHDKAAWAALSGLLFGLAALMRSSSLFLPILLFPYIWQVSGGSLKKRLAVGLTFLIAAAVTLVPTITRNYCLFGCFIPVRTGSGASLMEALGPWADGGPGMDRIEYPDFPPGDDECQRDRLCRAAAWSWAGEHPAEVLRLAGAKLRRTWSITVNAADYASPLATVAAWLTVAPEFALIVGGIFLLRRERTTLLLLLVPAIYFTLLHAVFVGSVRYRVPAMPFLFILAAVALNRAYNAVRGGRRPV